MSDIRVRYETIEFGDVDIHVRALRDNQEFQDDDGEAADLGISSATWSLFGVVWDAGRSLARSMADYDIAGRRVLEVGCGIGLASLVLNQRSCDITATDRHPEAGGFLQANTRLNGDPPIPFERTGWSDREDTLGRFDLIIGSDVLYESSHAGELSGFIDRHAHATCDVLLVDPGRGELGRFGRAMETMGYVHSRLPAHAGTSEPPFVGHLLRFSRVTGSPGASE